LSMHLWQVVRWAREDRDVLTRAETYAAAVREECAYFMEAGFAQNAARAGEYPAQGDSGWRYQYARLPVHEKLLRRYRLAEIAGEGSDFERALRLMDWLCAHTWYNGMSIWSAYLFQRRESSARMLRYAYDRPFAHALNCKHRALLLADCLLALGVPALPLWLRNESWREGGPEGAFRHCAVHAWLRDERRWVMLDPSFNSYIADGAGRALNLIEIQARHRRGEEIRAARYAFNGTQECKDLYLDGFLLASLLYIYARSGTKDRREPCNCLAPEDMPLKGKDIRGITVAELLAEPAQEGGGS